MSVSNTNIVVSIDHLVHAFQSYQHIFSGSNAERCNHYTRQQQCM